MLRVVIVDDSPVARDLLQEIIDSEADMEVVGLASDGAEGVELVLQLQPDIVTMDVQMPRMDGYAATRRIMTERPTPIVVVSGSSDSPDVEKSMESLRAGALTVVGKPSAPTTARFDKAARSLVDAVRAMAGVKVVRQRAATPICEHTAPRETARSCDVEVVAMAASTGGPQALHRLLSLLPGDYPLPILLVQHISRGFLDGFVAWLDECLPMKVVIPQSGEILQSATVYVAPEDRHLGVSPRGRICLSDDPPVEGFRPAASALFESVARTYGQRAVACILTGMGRDGVRGLEAVRRRGGLIFAQNEESSIVYGMPAAAAAAGLVDRLESIEGIAAALVDLLTRKAE